MASHFAALRRHYRSMVEESHSEGVHARHTLLHPPLPLPLPPAITPAMCAYMRGDNPTWTPSGTKIGMVHCARVCVSM